MTQFNITGPKPDTSHLVRRYWEVRDESTEPEIKEIIPDGYPEIIFHFGDPYRINIDGSWRMQDRNLIAGQIKKHFRLENTGASDMFGIKLQPWAMAMLLSIDSSSLTDNVIPLDPTKHPRLVALASNIAASEHFQDRVNASEEFLLDFIRANPIEPRPEQEIVSEIIRCNGTVELSQLLSDHGVHERSLERYFKKHIGLTPKFYCRIIRFSHILHLAGEEPRDWSAITYAAGFYDQSHFIRNFKEFTGKEPTAYGFNEQTMANFFFER